MSDNLNKAISILNSDKSLSCVVFGDGKAYLSVEPGIKPLLEFCEGDVDMKGFSAADKIVGRAASFMYIRLGISEIYAEVLSKPATQLLDKYGISYKYGQLVEKIINRKGDDICPMDKTVLSINDPDKAYEALRNKVAEMIKQNKERKKMNKEEVIQVVKDIVEAHSCCSDLKTIAQQYLMSLGKEDEKVLAQALVAEAQDDIASIDDVIGFFSSDMAASIFGEEVALKNKERLIAKKAEGELYCDCPACQGCLKLVENKDVILL